MLRGEFAAPQHHRRDGSLLRFLSPTECPSRAAAISKRNNWAEQYWCIPFFCAAALHKNSPLAQKLGRLHKNAILAVIAAYD
jgi:hypothetical protein